MKKISLLILFFLKTSLYAQTIYLSENFSGMQLPLGWSMYNSQTPCVGWEFGDSLGSAGFVIPPNGTYAAVNDDKYDNSAGTANLSNKCYLTSPYINASTADSLHLEFDYFTGVDPYGEARVELSTNGVSYNYAYVLTDYSGWTHFSWNIPSSYFVNNFRFRIVYNDNDTKAKGLAVTNVLLTDPPTLDLGLKNVFHSDIIPCQNGQIGGEVINNGLTDVTSFAVNVYLDNNLVQTESYAGIDIAYQENYLFRISSGLPGISAGSHHFKFEIFDVNNQPTDANSSNNINEFDLKAVVDLPEHHPVVIDKTGAWCTFCAEGSLFLDSSVANYPNSIPVAMHGGDMMDSASLSFTGSQFASLFLLGGYPKLGVDVYKFSSLVNIGTSPWDYKPLVAQRNFMYEPIGVELSNVTWDPVNSVVQATVTATVYDTVADDLRINLWVLANEVYGTGTGWDQYNSANAYPGEPLYGWGDPIIGFHHKDVLLSMRGGSRGTVGIIPLPAYPGSVYQQTYSMQVPSIMPGSTGQTNVIDVNNISLIGLVQKYSNDINDCRILNAKSGALNSFLSDVDEMEHSQNLLVYPQPAKDFVVLQATSGKLKSVTIYSFDGKEVFNSTGSGTQFVLSTADFESGIYFMKVLLDSGSEEAMKLVVSN